jgi:hypothetical protein
MAFAAETRAAAVASFERMTPTSTFNAVLVWLRASERISVKLFGIGNSRFLNASRGNVRDELNEQRLHENPSHSASAISPASASDIKYAVMRFPCVDKNVRHDRGKRSFQARTLSLS